MFIHHIVFIANIQKTSPLRQTPTSKMLQEKNDNILGFVKGM